MTALDRAFIKAYASRRPLRGATGESSAPLGELERGEKSYRIDRAHGSSPAQIAAPHSKSAARRPRRPSVESGVSVSEPMDAGLPEAATETLIRRDRLIVSVNDAVPTTDWIWQREPSPVFADQASTADPVPAAARRPADRPSLGKLFTPEVLSLGLAAPAVVPAAAPPIAAPPMTPPTILTSPAMPPKSILPLASFLSPLATAAAPIAPAAASTAVAPQALSTESIALPAGPSSTTGPLSSFTIAPRVEDRLQPALEVDRFLWPAECSKLFGAAEPAIERFAAQLGEAAHCGQRRVALVGATAGAGTTSVALCLARMAHRTEAWWGLVDADFAHARLARQLGIAETGGWPAVVSGRERLADISIASLDDHLVLVPLSSEKVDQRELAASFRVPVMFSMLAESVDLVLIDAGTVAALNSLSALARGARIDAVYVVYDERSTSPAALAACAGRLKSVGINVAGAIANFAAA
jgi:Mrp family chromosome partitioning ATPase